MRAPAGRRGWAIGGAVLALVTGVALLVPDGDSPVEPGPARTPLDTWMPTVLRWGFPRSA
ncbi:hypothetical protein ACFQ1L_35450 [Phytohabitans flavus]